MKKLFISLYIFASCRSSDVVSISDASKDSVFQIKTKTTYPTTLQLHIQGRVNDTFIINNILIPGGIVDTTIKYDWYIKDFQINFKAYNVSKGSLIIKYKL
jgi:hypothetical protein